MLKLKLAEQMTDDRVPACLAAVHRHLLATPGVNLADDMREIKKA